MDKVAIVILNWNGRDILSRFLPSVVRHSQPQGTVYVADNGSTDDSLALLRSNFPQVRVISLAQNYGFAQGYNLALEQVEAEYAVLLNSDVEVSEGWLKPLTNYLDAHPDTVACQPKILSWHHRELFEYAGAAGGFIDRYGYPFCRGRVLGTIEPDNGQYDQPYEIDWATGAALCIKLAEYRQAGGLDARFFAHMEEIDLCWRLRSRGWKLACVPQSVVYHVGAATLKRENPRKTYLNFRNNLLMLYKNLPENRLQPVMNMRLCLDAVAALQFLCTGQWDNAAAVWHARRDYLAMKKDYAMVRRDNLRAHTPQAAFICAPFSIIFSYYLLGRRTWTALQR